MPSIPFAVLLAVAALLITAIAHVVISKVIDLVEAAANANPPRLRPGTSRADALAQVAKWRQTRKTLWPLGLILAGSGVLIAYLFR